MAPFVPISAPAEAASTLSGVTRTTTQDHVYPSFEIRRPQDDEPPLLVADGLDPHPGHDLEAVRDELLAHGGPELG